MKWFTNLLSSLQGVGTKLPNLPLLGSFKKVAGVTIEQTLEGFLAFMFFALVERYLPFWAPPALIAFFGGVAVYFLGRNYKVGIGTFIGLSVFYYFASQPVIVLLLSGLVGVAAAVAAAVYTKRTWYLRVIAAVLALFVAPVLTASLYLILYTLVLPAVHPATIWTWNLAPLLSNIPTLAILGYCAMRQRDGQHHKYWLAMPVLSVLFCVCFWPTHSYLGMAFCVITAVALSVYALIERPTSKRPGRPERPFAAATAVAVAFSALFLLSNSWQWLYNYQMASAITVTEIDAADMPATEHSRQVPIVAAGDYCRTSNQEQVTTIATSPFPLVIKDSQGVNQFYWECIRRPDTAFLHSNPGLYLTHLVALTGGVNGAVLANAGDRGRYGEPINTDFVFGDESALAIGAFYARHPGATRHPGMIALTVEGDADFIIPFTNKGLQTGAMIPELSGVMVISPYGFIQDMLPEQAAAKFPGVHFIPSELAHDYAALWGSSSHNLRKLVDASQQVELSELANESGNQQPFWEDFQPSDKGMKGGLYGVLYFEPAGSQQNAWVRIGLFDRATLSMTVVHVENLNLTGPKQLAAGAAIAAHPGLNQVTSREPLLEVSSNHCIYLLTALLQQTNAAYHGYSANNLVDGHGHRYQDVNSRADIAAAMADREGSSTTCGVPSK